MFLVLTVVDCRVDLTPGVVEASMVVICDVISDGLEGLIPS